MGTIKTGAIQPEILLAQTQNETQSQDEVLRKTIETQNETLNQISPDGIMLLIVEQSKNSNGILSFDLFVKKEEQEKIWVYSGQLSTQSSLEIPHNTWSPDNKYFFIKTNTPTSQRYLLFKESGEKFGEEDYLDVTSLFEQKEFSYSLKDITGWAAKSLLLVRTLKENSEMGPSFWFDLSNKSFIQLSTQF